MGFGDRIYNIIVACDQLGNATGGGNRDTTISGRAFYNDMRGRGIFWRVFRSFVDISFYGLDGKGHCEQSYFGDKGEVYHDASVFDKLILLVLSIPVCIVAASIGYPYALLKALRG